MGEAKPTPGPWTIYLNTMDDVVIRKMNAAGYEDCVIARKVSHRDARLIADAGTVFHTTGLTPSQLVERVKELEETLRQILQAPQDTMSDGKALKDIVRKARAALSKARPNTAEGEAIP